MWGNLDENVFANCVSAELIDELLQEIKNKNN